MITAYEIYLFFGMLIAATLSGIAIKMSMSLAEYKITFFESVGLFLAFRVAMFMSSKDSELTDSFVHYLSVERSKWAIATIAVCSVMIFSKRLIFYVNSKRK